MATTADDTAIDLAKDFAQAHTPVSRTFNHLLARLETFIAQEKALDAPGIDVMSATFKKDLTDAEAVREALCEAVGETVITPDHRPEDRSLRRLTHVLYVMLATEDDGDRQHIYASTIQHRDLFPIDSRTAAARLTRRLSQSFFSQFNDLASLREFGGDGHVACPEPDVAPLPA